MVIFGPQELNIPHYYYSLLFSLNRATKSRCLGKLGVSPSCGSALLFSLSSVHLGLFRSSLFAAIHHVLLAVFLPTIFFHTRGAVTRPMLSIRSVFFPCLCYPALLFVLCYWLGHESCLLLSTSTFRGNLNACTLRMDPAKSNISVRYT